MSLSFEEILLLSLIIICLFFGIKSVIHTKHYSSEEKIVWSILIILFTVFGFAGHLVYRHVRKKPI